MSNTGSVIEFLGRANDDDAALIAGLLISLVGTEPAGLAIDYLRFGRAGELVIPGAAPSRACSRLPVCLALTRGPARRPRNRRAAAGGSGYGG